MSSVPISGRDRDAGGSATTDTELSRFPAPHETRYYWWLVGLGCPPMIGAACAVVRRPSE